ncbi:hypothetical protein [Nonomuraea jabiensis]|uniref:Uncharacterized protein n=1 Tax=Nonomuraea jabiensis TaxID=882448 RepID=A0A7W9FYR5_9ACTN|nr:hypothetical protein [Nonomuraea jabiensis]MBB5774001.1 hypothetical protein [Nonomuraea jabiensis]
MIALAEASAMVGLLFSVMAGIAAATHALAGIVKAARLGVGEHAERRHPGLRGRVRCVH